MRNVAGTASLHFDGGVLENEGTMLIDVTLEADAVLRGRHADLLGQFCAVGIVAIGALHQTLVDAMVKGHGELGLLLEVAGVAQLGLGFDQQELLGLRVVR
jgi:hypothetical protein